jgi:membrane fusion protein (multidrug efflux system)
MSKIIENTEIIESAENVEQVAPKKPETPNLSSPKNPLKKGGTRWNRMKIALLNTFMFLIIAVAFGWAIKAYFKIGDDNYTNAAQVEAFINPINSRVSAYITEIRFIEHQKVKKGDTLVILDNREVLTQVAQAEAAYMNALASENTTKSTINTVSNNQNVVDANIAGAKARLWNAEQNMNRYKNLLKDEAVTQQQYDQIKTEYDAQLSSYESLVNQKNSANYATTEVKSRIGMNEAEIKRTKAALDMAKLNLSYCLITAPYDGIMGRRMIQEGQLLQTPGMQVATIVTSENKWISANFREKQMSSITIGKKMMIKVDALNDKEFEGEVTAISAATGSKYSTVPVDNSTGNFVKVQQRIPVHIEFTKNNKPEDLELLRAGMNVTIELK